MKHRAYQKSPGTVLIAGKEERLFIPNLAEPLPPIVWSASLLSAFEKAHLAVGRLNGLVAAFPDVLPMQNMFGIMEAVASAEVEGADISLTDVLLFELGREPSAATSEVRRVRQTAQALRECRCLLDDKSPLSLRLIGKLHRVLSEGEGEEASPSVASWIMGCFDDNDPVSPPQQTVRDCMIKLERFLQDYDVPTPALLKAALAYAWFSSLHPSLGRLGRILVAAILNAQGMVTGPAICVSWYIVSHRNRYESTLGAAKDAGKWTGWLEFFAEAVTWAAEQSEAAMGRLRAVAMDDRKRIETLGRAADSTRKVQQAFLEHPVTAPLRLAKATGLTPMTVNKSLAHLERLSIVRELSGKPRNRLYQYDQYIAVMNHLAVPKRNR